MWSFDMKFALLGIMFLILMLRLLYISEIEVKYEERLYNLRENTLGYKATEDRLKLISREMNSILLTLFALGGYSWWHVAMVIKEALKYL
jgi:hypothetical protein